jgi:hypothetical protein
MDHLGTIVSHPLRIVREFGEASFEPLNSRIALGPFAISANLAYSLALARYCSEVNIASPSVELDNT